MHVRMEGVQRFHTFMFFTLTLKLKLRITFCSILNLGVTVKDKIDKISSRKYNQLQKDFCYAFTIRNKCRLCIKRFKLDIKTKINRFLL